MTARIKFISSTSDVDRLFEESAARPVAIFKHSASCGISAHVLEMVEQADTDLNIVVVQEARDVSNAIAERTGYVHHSPQAFVIKDREVVYHATHYAIDPVKMENALNQ